MIKFLVFTQIISSKATVEPTEDTKNAETPGTKAVRETMDFSRQYLRRFVTRLQCSRAPECMGTQTLFPYDLTS
jgi:hypothetical protein